MEESPQTRSERRTSERMQVVRPAKVFDPRAHRYHAAQTCNISAGGALLKVQRTLPVFSGDRLEVVIEAEEEVRRLLSLDDAVESRVVRVRAIDRYTQSVAVQFHAGEESAAQEPPDPVIHTRVAPIRGRTQRAAA